MKTLVKYSILTLLTLLIISICIIVYLSFGIQTVYAHPGSLDENGGHYDHSDGSYHYHNGNNDSSGDGSGQGSGSDTPDKEVEKEDDFLKSFLLYYSLAYTIFLLLFFSGMRIKWKSDTIESVFYGGSAIIMLSFVILCFIYPYAFLPLVFIPFTGGAIYIGIETLFLSKRKKPSVSDDINSNKPKDIPNIKNSSDDAINICMRIASEHPSAPEVEPICNEELASSEDNIYVFEQYSQSEYDMMFANDYNDCIITLDDLSYEIESEKREQERLADIMLDAIEKNRLLNTNLEFNSINHLNHYDPVIDEDITKTEQMIEEEERLADIALLAIEEKRLLEESNNANDTTISINDCNGIDSTIDLEHMNNIQPTSNTSLLFYSEPPITHTHKHTNIDYYKYKNISIPQLIKEVIVDPIKNINFEDKAFVFTGDSSKFCRIDAMINVLSKGGNLKPGVSKKVDYLVTSSTEDTVKYRKAKELQAVGHHIKILTDNQFIKMVETDVNEYYEINEIEVN